MPHNSPVDVDSSQWPTLAYKVKNLHIFISAAFVSHIYIAEIIQDYYTGDEIKQKQIFVVCKQLWNPFSVLIIVFFY